MKLIYIQTFQIGKKTEIPYRITIGNATDLSELFTSLFRPEITVSKKIYEFYNLNRIELLSAPPFCDIADELIAFFQDEEVAFYDRRQVTLLKSQFRRIGYNFNANPKILCHNKLLDSQLKFSTLNAYSDNVYNAQYGEKFIKFMRSLITENNEKILTNNADSKQKKRFDLSNYKSNPGVYFFLDEFNGVLYVGKTKNIKKRLNSHFLNTSVNSNIDYLKISSISVEYTGNDLIAQLIESENIKFLKPIYNTQQIMDAAPFIINKGQTAKGISRLRITRKDIKDNMPEKHFNRLSVKQSLEEFCTTYHLCRKHCGLETVKGPCSNNTIKHENCVCAGNESMTLYNNRFDKAFNLFLNTKSRKVFKLKGRCRDEDAFIYTVNGIYEGYGFIDKNDTILTENDILGNLISMSSNYDTSRIISGLSERVSQENILILEQ